MRPYTGAFCAENRRPLITTLPDGEPKFIDTCISIKKNSPSVSETFDCVGLGSRRALRCTEYNSSG